MEKNIIKTEEEVTAEYEYRVKYYDHPRGYKVTTRKTKVSMNFHRAGRSPNDFYAFAFNVDLFRVKMDNALGYGGERGSKAIMTDVANECNSLVMKSGRNDGGRVMDLHSHGYNGGHCGEMVMFENGDDALRGFEKAQELIEQRIAEKEQEAEEWELQEAQNQAYYASVNASRQAQAKDLFANL